MENTPTETLTETGAPPEKSAFRHILSAAGWPLFFVSVLWLIEGCFQFGSLRAVEWGNMPRSFEGMLGILFAPFIHAGIDHLLSNSLPLMIIGSGIFHFYRQIAVKVILMIWIFTGCWVWLMARPDYHIGASGLIYGGVTFLFFSGIFRRDVRLMSISMLVVFLYGSLAWGIFPIDPTQSWETHLSGSIAGIFAANYFKKEGPERKVYQWEIDELLGNENKMKRDGFDGPHIQEDDIPFQERTQEENTISQIKIRYHYRDSGDQQKKPD